MRWRGGDSNELERLACDDARAVEDFLAAASRVPAEAWRRPAAPGKWSPGQVVLHVALAYEVASCELDGGAAMRLRVPWWLRPALRVVYLRRILSTGRVPEGAIAPREVRPPESVPDREDVFGRIRSAAGAVESRMREAGGRARLTHPYFGAIRGAAILRFLAVHTRHHASQLAPPASEKGVA
jgi:hypothetical protein